MGGAPCAWGFILGLGGPKGGYFVGPREAGVVGQRTPWTVPRGGVGCVEVGMWATPLSPHVIH